MHIYILKDDMDQDTWNKKRMAVFLDLYKKATKFGGEVSGEHGIGYAKLPYFMEEESEQVYNLMKSIKQAFDPNNIPNPGKVIDLSISEKY
jgi:FAD/FMN-containing dehydrogenases